MSTEGFPAVKEWINDHPVEYGQLFDDGALESQASEILAKLPNLDPEAIPSSFLARHNDVRNRLPHDRSRLIHRGVEKILYASYEGKFGDEHTFLQDLGPDKLKRMNIMTAQLIFAWERGCKQHRMPSRFKELYGDSDVPLDDVERPPITLVLMGAAALRYVRRHVLYTAVGPTPRIKGVSMYGPQYNLGQNGEPLREMEYPDLDEFQD